MFRSHDLDRSFMISFPKLGALGRLGNQLFQYAFVRTTARRLGVPFYCPPWQGDEIFALDDAAERTQAPGPSQQKYQEPYANTGFNPPAVQIIDGSEVQGYFQTPRYFNAEAVRTWFRFRPSAVEAVARKYADIDFSDSVGLHLRLGDFITTFSEFFYVPTPAYYRQALKRLPRRKHVIVFSDDIPAARRMLKDLGPATIFIEGNSAHEDLYLQTLCHDFVCSPSTFSWWGAFLNPLADKNIVAPREGLFRPGSPLHNRDFWPEEWTRVKAMRGLRDHHFFYMRQKRVLHLMAKLQKIGK